ncbi:RHS repeat-associated core domain-containing protein [bacterium]|nr:RHS repeat-associated core domain-containing protein [bacterium]
MGGSSSQPIRYLNGEVQYAVTDLEADGFGKPWQQRRVYSNQLSQNGSLTSTDMGNGYNWLVQDWPYLVQGLDGLITFVRGTKYSLQFDDNSGVYTGRFGAKSTLVHDTANHLLVLTQPSGERWKFHDFDQSTYPQGQFASHLTPGDQAMSANSYTGDGHIESLERAVTVDGTTTTEAFAYTYTSASRIETVTLRRQVDSGSWEDIRQVAYTYYGSEDPNGSAGDLKTVTRKQWNGSNWDSLGVSYYRYWLSGQANGFAHGLKYILGEASYARMVADVYNPLTADNAQLALYADNYFEYDSQQRAKKEIVYGGSQTFTFSYTQSSNSDDYNHWKMKTVETLPDENQVIVYTNYIGQVILKELKSGSDSWLEYHQFDDDGHKILMAEPSAINSYSEGSADLNVTLKSSEGLIHLTEYYPSAGSSSSSSGMSGPGGYKKAEKLQQGSSGTPILQKSWEYAVQTVGGNTIYPKSKETVYRNDDGTGAIETTFNYTYYSGTLRVQQMTTTLPVVPTHQNGSGIATTRKVYLDEYGNPTWSMNERGYITRLKYDIPTGAMTQRIDDVDSSIEADVPGGWATPSDGGLNLITDYEHDDLGRITQMLGPWHTIDIDGTATDVRRASWTVYDESASRNVTRTAEGYATGTAPNYTYTLVNPVSIVIHAKNDKLQQQIQATRASISGKLMPSDTFVQASYTRWTTFQYTDCCNLASQRGYHMIPASGEGSPGTNYDQTSYGYDAMKRRNRDVTPGGTITRTVFDSRGLAISTWMGTNDAGASVSDPTGGGATGNNMVVITEFQYDYGNDSGDGNLTRRTAYASGTDTRATTFQYDFRNRRIFIDGEIDFYQTNAYDNLNQLIETERYDTDNAGNLIARREIKYDDRGRVYRTITYGVDPSTGSVGNALTSNHWYDAAGNEIKSLPAGSKLFSKSTYDSLGRQTVQFQGYELDESNYVEAGNVDGDTILEQSESAYDAASNLIQTTTRQRYHNASSNQTGELKDPSTSPKARVTYTALYPDSLGRQQAAADYGTNGGSTLSRPSTIPVRSNMILVTSQTYDDAGNAESSTDPACMVVKMEYDAAGRPTATVMNYLPSTSSSSSEGTCLASDDTNIIVRMAYNGDGNMSSITAENSATGDQVTQYEYGTTLSDSDVATSLWKRKEIYPDSVDGSDVILFAYNRQQQKTSMTDQNGTVHIYEYDKLGRMTQDRVTTLGSDVDDSVRRIATTYEVRGMRETITSHDHPDMGSGNVVNEVQFAYNEFSQLITDYQAHGGAVNTSTTPKVEYSYVTGSANTVRPTTLTYPDGRVLTYDYGTAGGIDDAASRVAALVDDDGSSTHLVDYSYLGMGSPAQSVNTPFGQGFVIADYTQPNTKWTLADLSGANDPDTGDIYSGLDRFGRVKDNRWYDYGSSADLERIKYGYDRASNRIWRQNIVADALSQSFDELYGYDGVNRLKEMSRGTLNAQKDGITNQSLAECWSLDATGNWQKYLEDANGNGTWNLNQARTGNTVNEITNITEMAGISWATPAYNRAGNMTTIPQPDDLANSYSATYDAWNRLVKLADGASLVAEYEYDGAKRRTVVKSYISGSLDETRHYYFTEPDQWQVVEERVDTSTDAEQQHVWGLRYIDDLMLRDRDTTGNGVFNERLYAMQDANWNVTALTDTAGIVQERFTYQPYGESQGLNPDFTSYSGSELNWEVRYTGRSVEFGSHFLCFRNRLYISKLGSFATRDPIRYVGGTNFYSAKTGPSSLDPSGLQELGPLRSHSCEIEICSMPIGLTGYTSGHLFIIAGGDRFRGGPSLGDENVDQLREKGFLPKCEDINSVFGQLVCRVDPWAEKPWDHPENSDKGRAYPSWLKWCTRHTISNQSCESVKKCFYKVAESVNDCCIPYQPVPPLVIPSVGNSNSVVAWMIKSCVTTDKIFEPVWLPFGRPHPGFSQPMPECVKKKLQ